MSGVRNLFRAATGLVCLHSVNWTLKSDITSQVIPEPERSIDNDSYAQVESLVLPNSRGGLKPGGITWSEGTEGSDSKKRISPLTIRLSAAQKKIIQAKAQSAELSVNRFVLASALGSDYKPPIDKELARALLRIYRELNAQGNNLNQIAWQLNTGIVPPGQHALLESLSLSIQQTLVHVRVALADSKPRVQS
jgi:hypothetical protein